VNNNGYKNMMKKYNEKGNCGRLQTVENGIDEYK
jgi:hypothetical protein